MAYTPHTRTLTCGLILTFTKRVGSKTVKNEAADLIGRMCDTLAFDYDFNGQALEVRFTNDRNTGAAEYSAGLKETARSTDSYGRVTMMAVESTCTEATPVLRCNLQGDSNALNNRSANHLMHEFIHHLQYALGVNRTVVKKTAQAGMVFKDGGHTWDATLGRELSRRMRSAGGRGFLAEASEDFTGWNTTGDLVNHALGVAYGKDPSERQAWRGASHLARWAGFENDADVKASLRGFLARWGRLTFE
tara:strand:+ start:4862 stop:5605 length:744 start_codon:yes stop_codon:yes gene_type:complete